jgi:uncharacterized protein (UPF0261 family)
MVNFGEMASVPDKFAERNFYIHNPQVTLMRTTPQECAELGKIIAQKTNHYGSRAAILIPKKAISVISAAGQAFHDPEADEALFAAIRNHAEVPVEELDEEINSPVFAKACAEKLLHLMANHESC